MNIPQTQFTTPDYQISRVIRGNWQLSSSHSQTQDHDLDTLLHYLENGVTTFDMADIYTGVEELFGAFRQHVEVNRPDLLGAMKVHTKYVPDRGKLPTLSKKDTTEIIDRSLQRLQMDQLDLVQFHWWDYDIPGYLDTLSHLFDLKADGKIREIGVTNFSPDKVREMIDNSLGPASIQLQYSVMDQRPNKAMAELCKKHGVKILCYGTLGGGFLHERWIGQPDPGLNGDNHENRSLTKYRWIIEDVGGWEAFQGLLVELKTIGENVGMTIAQVVTRFILESQGVTAVIMGARNEKHLQSTLGVFGLDYSEVTSEAVLQAIEPLKELKGDVYDLERTDARHAGIMRYDLNTKDPKAA